MNDLVDRNTIGWLEKKIIKTSDKGPVSEHTYKYSLVLPQFLYDWDVYDYWEKERLASLQDNLNFGDVFYDIGAEHGWLSALIAKYIVGAENMALFEPTPEFWPNIKAIWEANQLASPMFCSQALVGDESTPNAYTHEFSTDLEWPECAYSDWLVPKLSYRYLHETSHRNITPQITIDEAIKLLLVKPPKAINVDVEGAEIHVMRGAVETLRRDRPLVWVSVHPDLGIKNYNTTPEQFHQFMRSCDYSAEHLATDHEEHWLYRPL